MGEGCYKKKKAGVKEKWNRLFTEERVDSDTGNGMQ